MPEKNYMYKEFITKSTCTLFTALAKVEKQLPKKTVAWQKTNSWPTVVCALREIFPSTVGRLLADCRPTVGDLNIYPSLKSLINVRTHQETIITFPGSRAWVSTGCTSFFLDVVRWPSTAHTQSVCLVMALTKTWCSLSLKHKLVSRDDYTTWWLRWYH